MATSEQGIAGYANRWVAGQSGNPTGMRGKASPRLLDKLKAKLCAEYKVKAKKGEPEPSSSILGDLIVAELCRLALEGEDERVRFIAIKEILDRTEGKPSQTIDINSTEINVTLLAERLVEFAKKAKGVEIPAELAEKLILASLDQDKD